jgi:hypothetical protein
VKTGGTEWTIVSKRHQPRRLRLPHIQLGNTRSSESADCPQVTARTRGLPSDRTPRARQAVSRSLGGTVWVRLNASELQSAYSPRPGVKGSPIQIRPSQLVSKFFRIHLWLTKSQQFPVPPGHPDHPPPQAGQREVAGQHQLRRHLADCHPGQRRRARRPDRPLRAIMNCRATLPGTAPCPRDGRMKAHGRRAGRRLA